MMIKKLSAAITATTLVVIASSCSQAETLCDLVCDCEHCSDLDEARECEAIALSQEVAEIYECGSHWETWADCVENKGQCRADDATFTTFQLDYCDSFIDHGQSCAGNQDCNQAGAFCNNGSCMTRSCNGNPTQPCASDSDCPTGPDQCEEERQLLENCAQDASNIVLGSLFRTDNRQGGVDGG